MRIVKIIIFILLGLGVTLSIWGFVFMNSLKPIVVSFKDQGKQHIGIAKLKIN